MTKISTSHALTGCLSENLETSDIQPVSDVGWSPEDDELLLQNQAQGLYWSIIAAENFPNKSPNACQKRYEYLVERQNAKLLDDGKNKLEVSYAYMEVRSEMWSVLASLVGEKWQLVEKKCMEWGLKDLKETYRLAKKRDQQRYGDPGIGLLVEDENVVLEGLPIKSLGSHSPYPSPLSSRVTSQTSQSILNPQLAESHPSMQINSETPRASYTTDSALDELSDDESCSGTEDSTSSGSTTTAAHSSGCEGESLDETNVFISRKQLVLDRLMTHVYEILNVSGSRYHRHRGCSDSTSAHSEHSPPSATPTKRATKRKSSERSDDQDDEENARDSNKRPRKNGDVQESSQVEKKNFACPYFKHSPRKYLNSRSCAGPGGWESIHRLKEHLYRRHTLPPQCTRCCDTFKTEEQLKKHSRSPEGCIVREQEPLEGLDKSQVEKLKYRKSMFQAESVEEKWRIIYGILFPDVASELIPSPYYDSAVAEKPNDHPAKPLDLAEYEAYMNRELPRKVRQELEIAIGKIIGPVEETLKNKLEGLIRNCQERLSRDYLQTRLSSVRMPPDRDAEVEAPMQQTATAGPSCVATSPQPTEGNILDALARSTVPPDLSGDPECYPWTSSDLTHASFPDSAYCSDPLNTLPSDPWWQADNLEALDHVEIAAEGVMGAQKLSSNEDISLFTGKGKGKASIDNEYVDWAIVAFGGDGE